MLNYKNIKIKNSLKMIIMEENIPHIIIDNGGGYIKAGFSSELEPSSVLPTIVGYGKFGENKKEFYVGREIEILKSFPKLNYPIEHGYINNFDDMEKIWLSVLNDELKVAPEEFNVFLIEALLNKKENREKMAQIMFETFNVHGLNISYPGVLSLYSEGKYTGISVDLGDGLCQFYPIFKGFAFPQGLICHNLGGRDLTNKLFKNKKGIDFFDAQNIKEKECYVALDYKEEVKSIEPFEYELPDGSHIIIEDERIKCPETLFEEEHNIAKTCYDSIQKCDIDVRKNLYNNIILSGGTSMFKGLPERFKNEIKKLVPKSIKEEVKVISSNDRKYSAWIGGAIVSSKETFESIWIDKYDYEESGTDIVYKKCF